MEKDTNEIMTIKSENEIAETINQDINDILKELRAISKNSLEIKNQNGFESFFKQLKNIELLASYTNTIALLHQKTINLLVLLLNGTVRMKIDYNEIMKTIDILSKEDCNVQSLAYLLELKRTIEIIKERNEFISDEFDILDKKIQRVQKKWKITSLIFVFLCGLLIVYELIKIIIY
jgi:hypothetical protein